MIPLPASRYEVKCGWKWDKERQEYVDSGKGCGQRVFIEKLPGGKFKITNAENGRGGTVGEAHKCHNTGFHGGGPADGNWKRYWHEYHEAQMHFPCGGCGQRFNKYVNPVCPTCFRMICRQCGNRQTWIVIKGQDSTICNACGGNTDCIQVFFPGDLAKIRKEEEVIDPLA